jgi:glutathione synthase/RimK-type ligase-like ATP-grasp enzyme
MGKRVKNWPAVMRVRKSMLFSRLRQLLPMRDEGYVDDRGRIEDAEPVLIDWPAAVPKPRIGVVRDLEPFPRWTKYLRFLETNGFPHGLFDLHAHDWIEKAASYDVVVGIVSNEVSRLEEVRVKYHVLEAFMGKICYPSAEQALLYENKCLEADIAQIYGLPMARTFVSRSREDALAGLDTLRYPLVSKVNQSSGSLGVELVKSPREARRIVHQAFSRNGRRVHVPWFRQRHYVYFQEFVPNDGYDVRVVLVGDRAFGYYRKVPRGDFRASGMGAVEKRALPEEAIRVAQRVQRCVPSPQVIVDMVRGLDGRYAIIEYSLFYQVETAEQLIIDGVPGYYVVEGDGPIRFEKGRYWVHELALRRFLLDDYLPRVRGASRPASRESGGGA